MNAPNFALPINFEVFNCFGALVKNGTLNNQKSTIDLANYKKGVYFLKIKNGNKESTMKVILQ